MSAAETLQQILAGYSLPWGGQTAPRPSSAMQPQLAAQTMGQSGFSQGAFGGQSAGGGGFASPLPPGGIYGTQKWAPGNGIDVFVQRGTPIYAPFDGTVGQNPRAMPSPMGPVPSFLLQGQNGITFQATHAQMTAQGPVRAGQQIGVVNDPGLDILGPYQGMPDGFQHLDITMGHGGPFDVTGGDINARDWLQQIGYQGQMIPGQTRGPNGGGGGMGMGGFPGMGGMGGPMGMMGGMPGMGMGGSPFGGGGAFGSPFGGSPFMGGGGMGGMGGGMGMPGMGMGGGMGGFPGMGMGMPPMLGGGMFGGMGGNPFGGSPFMGGGGPAYPGMGFMGFGAGGLQQGLVPGTAGVGSQFGPVTQSGGTYSGGFPPMPQMGGFPGFTGGGASGLGSLFGGVPFGGF